MNKNNNLLKHSPLHSWRGAGGEVLFMLLSGFLAVASAQDTESQQSRALRAVAGIENTQSSYTIQLWTDRVNPSYKIGEPIRFFFLSDKPGYLTLFNLNADGKITILFPNQHEPEGKVEGGRVYQFPDREARYVYRAAGPSGQEIVKAIITSEKLSLLEVQKLDTNQALPVLTASAEGLTRDIAIKLKPVTPLSWAACHKLLFIETETVPQPEAAKQPFEARLWTDKASYKVGETIAFYLHANRDCYITLLNHGTSGKTTELFPNAYSKNNFVKAGQTYQIPSKDAAEIFEIQGPPGIERLELIATLDQHARVGGSMPGMTDAVFRPISQDQPSLARSIQLELSKHPDKKKLNCTLELAIEHDAQKEGVAP